MENPNVAQVLSERILSLRKEKGLTQEALAGRLGVSFQAVSKWENEQSCPDIALLPLLADIFEVTVDSLFGKEPPGEQTARHEEEWGNNPVFSTCLDLPWGDDHTLHGVVYWGRTLLSHETMPKKKKKFTFDVNLSEYTWLLRYSPLNVNAECGLQVDGDIQGNAKADGYISCGNVGGDAQAGGYIRCGNVGGGAEAGGYVTCGNVEGDVEAGGYITCGNVGGDAQAGNEIKCGDVGGDVRAEKVTMKKN